MNPFSAIIRKLSGLEEAEKKAELVKQRNERALAPLRQKANQRLLQQKRTGSIPTNNLVGRGAGILKPEILQKTAYQSRLQEILDAKPDRSMIQLPNGVYVNPQSQNNLASFANAAATQLVYNNPLSPKAWANMYNSGREAIGTWTGNEGLRDAGTRGLQERRDMEAFNNAQAMDQRANFAGNAFAGVLNAGTQPFKIPQGRMGIATLGAQAIPRYGLPTAADTGFAIREAGGSETAQKLGSGATGFTTTLMGTFGMGRLGQPNAGTLSGKQGLNQVLRNVAISGNAEGMEELVEGGVDDLVARTTYDKNRSIGQTAQNLLTSYGVGAVSGGVLGGANARYGGETGKQEFKQDKETVNNEINLGKVTENKNKQITRRTTISAQKANALRNGNKAEYRRLSKVEADLNDSIKKLENREKFLGKSLGLSMKLTNDAELNAQSNTDTNQSPDQNNKISSPSDTNPLESLKQEARDEGYKYMTRDGSAKYKKLNKSNSFQDINGTNHPLGSDAKITVKNLDGTNETRTFTVKDIGNQEYFNKQLIKYGERGEIVSATIDSTPVLVKNPQTPQSKKPFNTFTEIAEGGAKVSNQAKTAKQEAPDFLQPQATPQNPITQTQQTQQEKAKALESQEKSQANSQVVQDKTVSSSSNQSLSENKKPNQTQQRVLKDPVANALGITDTQLAEQKLERGKSAQDSSFGGIIPSDAQLDKLSNQDASRPAEYNGVATIPNSKNSRQLQDAVLNDSKITKAAEQAELEGKEFNYYALKDRSGRSVDIQKFNPKQHRIESGMVIDSNGKILGNHIKVDPTGVAVNVGGEMVNMTDMIGDFSNIQNSYKVGQTMERNIYRVFKDKTKADKVYKFVIGNKLQNETNFRTELKAERDALKSRADQVNQAKPSNVKSGDYKADIFDYIEGNKSKKDLSSKYDQETVKQIEAYKKDTRKIYDSLLTRVNETFAKFGEERVAKRKDYLTHINELQSKPNFAGEMFGRLRNSALGEADGNTRSSVPAEISGRTGDFEPRKRWNRFFQERKGGEFTKDPFKAVDSYLEPSLYNIHMTESAVRARSVEAAIRTAGKFESEFDPKVVKKELSEAFKKNTKGSNNLDKVVNAWSEYANALTGKTNALDRWAIDKAGDSGPIALRGWQELQKIGGRATILGNAQSVLSQTLGIPSTIADTGVVNMVKGLKNMASRDSAIKKSRFVQSRITRVESPFRGRASKALDALGVPLQALEQQYVKATWYAEYEAAKQKGFKGDSAIVEADRMTERVVAGRGIADKPEIYRSTVANGFLQYTLEVNAQNQKFWKDFNTTQKAEYIVGAYMMNALMAAVTGFEPLPDFLGATVDSIKDFADDEEEKPEDERRGIANKVGATAQRFSGEAVNMNPFLMAVANQFPQPVRRNVFGQDSEVGRFDGQAAPIKVVERGISGAKNLIEGNIGNAASEFTRGFAPAGNQINKTVQGGASLFRGYSVDRAGNPTFAAPDDTLGKAQALVFGPNSTGEARQFYDNKQGSIKSKDDLEAIKNSSNKAQTVNEIQQNRGAETSGEVVNPSDTYGLVQDAFRKSDGELKGLKDYSSEDIRKAVNQVNSDFKSAFEATQLPVPKGMKFDTISAQKFASYAKSIENVNDLEAEKKTKSFFKSTYKDTLDDISQSFYTLGDDDMRTELQKGTISKQQMDKIIEIDDILTQAGLQKYPQVGKTLRAELGYGQMASSSSKSSGSRSSSRSGSRSGSRKSSFSIPDGFSLLPQGGSASGSIANLIRNAEVIYRKS